MRLIVIDLILYNVVSSYSFSRHSFFFSLSFFLSIITLNTFFQMQTFFFLSISLSENHSKFKRTIFNKNEILHSFSGWNVCYFVYCHFIHLSTHFIIVDIGNFQCNLSICMNEFKAFFLSACPVYSSKKKSWWIARKKKVSCDCFSLTRSLHKSLLLPAHPQSLQPHTQFHTHTKCMGGKTLKCIEIWMLEFQLGIH